MNQKHLSGPWEESTVVQQSITDPLPRRCHLQVFEGHSCTTYPLPLHGEVIIGRAREAGLPLQDDGASRRHACLVLAEGRAVIEDLGSHNGTLVNGAPLAGPRALSSGDVIAISQVTLIFHRGSGAAPHRALRSEAELLERLEDELERCRRYHSTCSVLCVELPDTADAGAAQAAQTVAAALRPPDLVACAQGQLLVLLPETGEEELEEGIGRLAEALSGQARLGSATCPADGTDADTLIAGARAAARGAQPGQCLGARQMVTEVLVGDRRVLLADPAMLRIYQLLQRLAEGDLAVLLCGETGTGKDLAAAVLHHGSGRKGPLVSLNCAAIPENLIEGELFGYERGAFSGAAAAKPGLLEEAHQGTLFLDEVGELPLAMQAKLLRVVEDRQVRRLGALRGRAVDVRFVAATNRNLDDEVNAGRFRRDLFFRLSVATVALPPLRDRPRELPLLAQAFLDDACRRAQRPRMSLSPAAMQLLRAHPFAGNLRELKNAMEYVAGTAGDEVVGPWHLPERIRASRSAPMAAAQPSEPSPLLRPLEEEIRELERRRIAEAIQAAGGQHQRAAELIGVPLRTFTRKVKLYGLRKGPAPGA